MKDKTPSLSLAAGTSGNEIVVKIDGDLAAVVRALAQRMFVTPEVAGEVLILQCVNSFNHTAVETDAREFVELALDVYGDGRLKENVDGKWRDWLSRKTEMDSRN